MAYQLKQSSFASTDTYKGQIYGIYVNNNGYDNIQARDCIYVGKTCQEYVGDRFIQHVSNDQGAPWYNKKYDYNNYKIWPYVPFQIEAFNNWTRFDIAVAEQYHMTNAILTCSAHLINNINALSKVKWEAYRNNSDVFTLPTKMDWGKKWNYSSLQKANESRDDSGSMWTDYDTNVPKSRLSGEMLQNIQKGSL